MSDTPGKGLRAQRSAKPMWLWPSIAAVAAVVVVELLAEARPAGADWLTRLLWPGDTAAGTALVQAVATSAITVTTLTFSVTVVALQLASQQFSPRLLREFTRDPVTRVVLSALAATFVGCLASLRHFREDTPPPVSLLALVLALGLLSLAAVLGFITHIVKVLRVDSMMLTVHHETTRAIDTFYPAYGDDRDAAHRIEEPPGPGTLVAATESGFVRAVDVATLVEGARSADGFVRLDVRPGDQVVRGTPVATTWGDVDELRSAVEEAIVVDYERTLDQDAAFGFRQLEDVAVRALSPGINDPVTAAHAVGHMGDLLVRLTECRLGATAHRDEDGVVRAVVPDRDLRYYLELACGQVRRYATREPTVLLALLRMLRDVATATRDAEQRAEVARQVERVVATASSELLDLDIEPVHEMGDRVVLALKGDVAEAYADRSGETRSI